MPHLGSKARGPAPDKIDLVQGKRYRGTVELAWYQAIATNEQVAQEFIRLGFEDVKVTGSGYIREGEGTWSKADQTIDRPPQIKKVEPVGA